MKDTYRILVEGIADKRFIEQLLESVFSQNIPSDNIIKTDGYTNLTATNKEQTFINEMLRTTDDGGINFVIFDADSNCERRRTELLDWKRRSNVDFELFLLPDNANSGELEDLLKLTEFFLYKNFFATHGLKFPAVRANLAEIVKQKP